ncbi:hypothetical protein QTP88_014971 [Uroleucon formosanum]
MIQKACKKNKKNLKRYLLAFICVTKLLLPCSLQYDAYKTSKKYRMKSHKIYIYATRQRPD